MRVDGVGRSRRARYIVISPWRGGGSDIFDKDIDILNNHVLMSWKQTATATSTLARARVYPRWGFLKFDLHQDYLVDPREELRQRPTSGGALIGASVEVVSAGRGLSVFPQFFLEQPWESGRGGVRESDATLTTPWRWKSMSAKVKCWAPADTWWGLGGIFWGEWRLKWRRARPDVLLSGAAGWAPRWRTPDLTFLTAFHYWLTSFWTRVRVEPFWN